MNEIFFSIILPTYNRSELLDGIINNICEQPVCSWELIIVDDSLVNIESLVLRRHDNRIKYFNRGKKLGISSARNFGAAKAVGRYLIFLDDDDKVSQSWLYDFEQTARGFPDSEIIFCGMEIINRNSRTSTTHLPKDELWRLIIPGCWIIDRKFFWKIDGYDERLLFGENTEMFFRVRAVDHKFRMINKINFFYYPSNDGGSKNLKNKIDSTLLILAKHPVFFAKNKNVKRLFLQLTGIACLRLGRIQEGRSHLVAAYLLNPFRMDTLLRLFISCSPWLTKKIYKILSYKD